MSLNDAQRQALAGIQQAAWEINQSVAAILAAEVVPVPSAVWAFPVGTEKYPPEKWYCAQYHNPVGANGHTGIDLNLDVSPWGDVDRGMPVCAVASGVVYVTGYSTSYLGSIIIQSEHNSAPLYVRCWHLADDAQFRLWKVGDRVFAGECLGHIGNYVLGEGGDHCHLDMRNQSFEPHWWFTSHPGGWLDPVPILEAHLDPPIVKAMLAKKK